MKIYYKLVLSLVIALTGCSPPSTNPPLKIVLQEEWPSYGVVYIAQEQGLFAKHGVSVSLNGVLGYVESFTSYKKNKPDAVFTMLADVITLNAEGMSSHFVYATDHSDSSDVIIAAPTINQIRELKGKKISIDGFNSFSHLMVLKLLKNSGLEEGEFEMVNYVGDPKKVLVALDSGEVQAGHVYGLAIPEALKRGYHIIGKAGDIPNLMIEGLAVSSETLKNRPQDIQHLVDALIEAMTWFVQFPEQGTEIIARYTNVPKEELITTFKRLHIFNYQDNQMLFQKDSPLFQGGKETIDFFSQRGLLLSTPDLNEVIIPQFIQFARTHP